MASLWVVLLLCSATLLTLILCTIQFRRHLRAGNFKWPEMQTCYLRVIMLAPVNATSALIVFLVPAEYAGLVLVGRALYEAYALFMFLMILVIHLGGRNKMTHLLLTNAQGDEDELQDALSCHCLPHYRWLRCFTFDTAGSWFDFRVAAVRQMMLVSPLLAAAGWIVSLNTPMHTHKSDGYKLAAIIMAGVAVTSLAVALHSILTVYARFRGSGSLAGLHAGAKVFAIKLAVLLTTVQQHAIEIMVRYGMIKPMFRPAHEEDQYNDKETGARMISALIILEMAFYSVLFLFLFSETDIQQPLESRLAQFVTSSNGQAMSNRVGDAAASSPGFAGMSSPMLAMQGPVRTKLYDDERICSRIWAVINCFGSDVQFESLTHRAGWANGSGSEYDDDDDSLDGLPRGPLVATDAGGGRSGAINAMGGPLLGSSGMSGMGYIPTPPFGPMRGGGGRAGPSGAFTPNLDEQLLLGRSID